MYVVELQFECFDNTTISAVDKAINGLMDALRYNGQVLGREFPVILGEGEFYVRAVCPEKRACIRSITPTLSRYALAVWQRRAC